MSKSPIYSINEVLFCVGQECRFGYFLTYFNSGQPRHGIIVGQVSEDIDQGRWFEILDLGRNELVKIHYGLIYEIPKFEEWRSNPLFRLVING